ncbi:MAG: DNA-binding protein [Lachnospiraceae bacterium]|nr:DNA-binding protein [Lachnospiraceae bacterium]
MDEIFKQTLLYDFYGELLTEHQKSVYEDFIFQDLSLSEIASLRGISRQGVFDLLHRINKSLENYEEKLHLVERFLLLKKDVTAIEAELTRLKASDPDADVSEMEQIITHMREMI